MKIRTAVTSSPLPQLGWCAFDEDASDGADDSRNITGYGRTEEEAIEDLKEQLETDR